MVDVKKFPYERIHSKQIDYNAYRDKNNKEEYIIHNLAFRIDDDTEWSSCIPDKKVQIENLAIEYTPEGKKKLASKANFWKTKFLNVTNSLTLIDCYFGTENFKAEKLKNDWIFRNIKELNLSLNEIPSMAEFEELFKMSPELLRIDFGEIRLNQDLLITILKYKNIKTIYCRGVEINLEKLDFNGNRLSIDISKIKDIEAIKNVLNNDIEIDLKLSGHFELALIAEILTSVTSLNCDNLDISDGELLQLIQKCSNLKELHINKCKNISNMDELLQNENLRIITIDGKKIKEHIVIYVANKKNMASIENYKEIDTLELIINDDTTYKDSVSCNNELLINNLIVRKIGSSSCYSNLRVVLSSSSRIKVNNSIYLDNFSFAKEFNKQDEMYKNTKKLITSQTGFSKGGQLDNFLSYATAIEEVEFTNQELNFKILRIITSHANIKKANFGDIELHLEGITISKDKMIINLDTLKDIEVIQSLIEKEGIEVTVEISDKSKIMNLERLAPYIKGLRLRKVEVTQEDLTKILDITKELKELEIEGCRPIQEIDNIEQYENLSLAKLDGKDLLQIPGVTVKENSYGKVNTMIIDLREYNGMLIRLPRYGEIKYLKVLLDSKNSLNDIKIDETNTITELQVVNPDEQENIRITKEAEEFYSKFKSIKKILFEKCDIDFRGFLNLENLKILSIDSSNLNNTKLRELAEICKGLIEIRINNCRNLTDVSALAQIENLKEIDVSNNRICKGVDLLINYLHIEKLMARNNLITNKQIAELFQNNELEEVDLSRNPITILTISKEKNKYMKINLEGCLLGTINIDKKFDVSNKVNIRTDGMLTEIYCTNNPLIEPSKYLAQQDMSLFTKQLNIAREIEKILILQDLPEEQKNIEYIKACKKYYNIPENGRIDKESKIYSAYIGTLAFRGIVCIEDDFYYYDGNEIQPIIEGNPQILLQDENQQTGILELYLGEEINASSNKIINMYRMLEEKPRRLEFEDQKILDIFCEELREKLPESMFVSFMDREGKTINMIELPKQIDIANGFPKKEFEMDLFKFSFGGVRIKFINQDGKIVFLNIPNEITPLNEESIELRKRNIATIKELINDEHFYLEQATDADIVIMEDEAQEEKLISFLTRYLPCKREKIISNKTAKQELMESFNLSDYTAILTYGQHIQQEVTERLDELRKKMTDLSEVDRVSSTLKRLNGVVEGKEEVFKPEKKRAFFQGLFRRKKEEEEYDNSDAEKQAQTIEQIKEELKASAASIIDSISNCKLVQNITRDYGEKLCRYIQVAKDKLEELKSQKGSSNEQIEMLERKIQSLEVSKVLAQQTNMQFDLVAKTKANLFEKVCTATQLIPILTSQSILRLNLDSQNDILELNENMYKYTQNTIICNANTLKETTERILNGKDSIEILRSVIKSVDEIAKATKNGLTSVEGTSNLSIEMSEETSENNKEIETI